MTETELIDQLRESIVLDGPDAWRSNGYLDDAQRMGWKLVPALKQASEISAELIHYRAWLQVIQTRIVRLAQLPGPPAEQDLEPIVRAAAALKLSADFVRNRWVPAELARLRSSSENGADTAFAFSADAADPLMSRPAVVAPASASAVRVNSTEPLVASGSVTSGLDLEPQPTTADVARPPEAEPLSVVQSFTATPNRIRRGEAVALAWVVDNLPTVTVDDLGVGLPTRHQGWVSPSKTTNYTLFDPGKKPLGTVLVEVVPRSYSVLYGVLGALLLIVGFLWYNNAGKPNRAPVRRSQSTVVQRRTSAENRLSKAYDKIEGSADERGWRRARSNGRWGFIDQDDEWVIQPEYDAVTQFRNNEAVVIRKGRLITINRDGEPVGK